jgi:hypothetical protein
MTSRRKAKNPEGTFNTPEKRYKIDGENLRSTLKFLFGNQLHH